MDNDILVNSSEKRVEMAILISEKYNLSKKIMRQRKIIKVLI